jgi:DNA repair exonuclease SbcCD ATPase subunit
MIDFLKPPTDNLYKFMAVAGTVLVIAGLYPALFFHQTGMEYLAYIRSSNEAKEHAKFTQERLATLDTRKQQAEGEKNELQAQLHKLNSGLSAAGNSAQIDKLESRINEADRRIESIEDAAHELRLDLALKQAHVRSEETVSLNRASDARFAVLVGWCVALTGAFLAFRGFFRWDRKLQHFQDRIVEKEAEAQLKATTETVDNVKHATPKPPQVEVAEPSE